MSRIVTIAATQRACSWDRAVKIANAEKRPIKPQDSALES